MDVTGSAEPEVMIRLSGVGKTYDDGTVAVQALDLTIDRGELVVLVGPSGCGKSTTLKMINRLIEPTTGTIEIDGEDVTRKDPVKLRRGIGYVIQQVGLFPHQKIINNVMTVPLLYGESRRPPGSGPASCSSWSAWTPRRTRDRYPHQLSGGQRSGRGGPRARGGPAGAAHGRAVRGGRPGGAGAAAGRVPPAPARARQDRRAGHPRHRRGRPDGRPGGGVRGRRAAGAVRHPDRAAGQAGRRLRGRLRGLDPGLRRLAVTPIDPAHLEPLDGVRTGDLGPRSTWTPRWRRRWPPCSRRTRRWWRSSRAPGSSGYSRRTASTGPCERRSRIDTASFARGCHPTRASSRSWRDPREHDGSARCASRRARSAREQTTGRRVRVNKRRVR